ncbi:uncharacterized protein G2W53_039824 [Senna tora]|uniref:Uncharacterized protein n=1 Tax=Senna tora TaxID=362788 RepID=A0A834W3W6_9FABA|nr:uncharacterized protein G2W53_039824 [Senna tora]
MESQQSEMQMTHQIYQRVQILAWVDRRESKSAKRVLVLATKLATALATASVAT